VSISDQVELAAWQHETRDTHGRWTHGGGGLGISHQAEGHGFRGRFEGYDPLVPGMAAADGRKPLDQPGRPDGAGTPADPIDVQGDMGRAVDLMAAGQHVRLNSTAEIAPLMNEINQRGDAELKATGAEPKWDLGNISVRGTRLFNEQTRGIPRSEMPQLSGPSVPGTESALLAHGANKFIELDPEFRAQAKADGIDVKNERVNAADLRATQSQLTATSVAGIARAAEQGNPKVRHMLSEPIWVSKDNYVIDGHHRWAADEVLAAMSGHFGSKQIEVSRIGLPAALAIPYANQFSQRMGMAARAIGNTKLVESANTITDQIELAGGWRNAWRTELRGPHGEWIKGITSQAGDTEHLSIAGLRKKVTTYLTTTNAEPAPAEPEVLGAISRGAALVPGLLGGGRELWNGTADTVPAKSWPDFFAEMEWDGTMKLRDDVAAGIKDVMDNPGKSVESPHSFEVILHELIHADIEHGPYQAHQAAYQNEENAAIEEGFTELGAIQHAPEWLNGMGIGDRKVPPFVGPGETSETRTDVAGYARNLQDPEKINTGRSWGHYARETRSAYQWALEVANAEGGLHGDALRKRAGELADEINRQGTRDKVPTMAIQVARASGAKPTSNKEQFVHGGISMPVGIMSNKDWYDLEADIREGWVPQMGKLSEVPGAFRNASNRVKSANQRMLEMEREAA
jgi:hypothetical protein